MPPGSLAALDAVQGIALYAPKQTPTAAHTPRPQPSRYGVPETSALTRYRRRPAWPRDSREPQRGMPAEFATASPKDLYPPKPGWGCREAVRSQCGQRQTRVRGESGTSNQTC